MKRPPETPLLPADLAVLDFKSSGGLADFQRRGCAAVRLSPGTEIRVLAGYRRFAVDIDEAENLFCGEVDVNGHALDRVRKIIRAGPTEIRRYAHDAPG